MKGTIETAVALWYIHLSRRKFFFIPVKFMNIKYVMIPDSNSFFRVYVSRLPKYCFSLFSSVTNTQSWRKRNFALSVKIGANLSTKWEGFLYSFSDDLSLDIL